MAQNLDSSEVQSDGKIKIFGKNIPVTQAMREHILDKIHKLEHISPQVVEVHVYLEVQKAEHRAEISYKFSHFRVVTHAVMDDMYQAIDLACVRVRRKLRKWKTRIQTHHGKNLSQAMVELHVLDRQKEDLNEINDQIEDVNLHVVEEELKPPEIKSKREYSIPMLTLDEAAMRIELSDDTFMVFRSEEDQKLKTIYLRRDHSLGLLEIE